MFACNVDHILRPWDLIMVHVDSGITINSHRRTCMWVLQPRCEYQEPFAARKLAAVTIYPVKIEIALTPYLKKDYDKSLIFLHNGLEVFEAPPAPEPTVLSLPINHSPKSIVLKYRKHLLNSVVNL